MSRAQITATLSAGVFCLGAAAAAPVTCLIAVSWMAPLLFLSVIALRLCALASPRTEAPAQPLSDDALPVYTLLIPLYQEADSLPGLTAAIEALDYPAHKIDAKLIIEADDSQTLEAAARLKLDNRFQIIAVPPAEPRTKPKALNVALAFARGQLVTIYDAEDWPDPQQLRQAAAILMREPGIACVQAPLNIYNSADNRLTRSFALEYAIHFHVWLPALIRWGLPVPLGGTSNHFRTLM